MNMVENKTVILSFSGRKNGNCMAIARHIQSMVGGEIYSFSNLDISPCGRCDYECFARGESCPYAGDDVRRIYDAVVHSDRAYYILPNYCDFPNAAFFAFNERSLCYFSGRQDLLDAYAGTQKKFIAVSGSESETIRAALRQHAEGEPDVLFMSAKRFGLNSLSGNLMTEPAAVQMLEGFVRNSKK